MGGRLRVRTYARLAGIVLTVEEELSVVVTCWHGQQGRLVSRVDQLDQNCSFKYVYIYLHIHTIWCARHCMSYMVDSYIDVLILISVEL